MKTIYFGLPIHAKSKIEHLVDLLSRLTLMRASLALQKPHIENQCDISFRCIQSNGGF